MKMYNVEIPVSDEMLARIEKLALARGATVEAELRFSVIVGLMDHMERNLSLFERMDREEA